MTQSKKNVAWVYHYRQPTLRIRPETLASSWKHPKPTITKDSVIFTAPDANSIFCVDLLTGQKKWKAQRKDDVYLAGVFENNVLLVGKDSTRALSAKTGQQVWETKTGLPSGVGTVSQGRYFLPLAKGNKSQKPEVAVLDPKEGKLLRRLPVAKGHIPGNLVFHRDAVVSQTSETIAVYPIKR